MFNVFIQKLTSFKLFLKITVIPKILLISVSKKYLGKVFINKKVVLEASKKELICAFSFLGKKSIQLKTRFLNSIESNLKFRKLKIIFQSPCKLNLLFRYKDSVQKKIRSYIIYRYIAPLFYQSCRAHAYFQFNWKAS